MPSQTRTHRSVVPDQWSLPTSFELRFPPENRVHGCSVQFFIEKKGEIWQIIQWIRLKRQKKFLRSNFGWSLQKASNWNLSNCPPKRRKCKECSYELYNFGSFECWDLYERYVGILHRWNSQLSGDNRSQWRWGVRDRQWVCDIVPARYK